MKKRRVVFITGVTGLIGSYLLKTCLEKGYKVFCLVRDAHKPAKSRISNILEFWSNDASVGGVKDFEVFAGDLNDENLGLNRRELAVLQDEVEDVFHCAAETNLKLNLNELRKTNVIGTENLFRMFEVWSKSGALRKVNYLSTAYVCGDHKGVFSENDLNVGQDFNTTYERSKFEAESSVEKFRKHGVRIDIFRPPLVLGESTTGKNIVFQSLFQAIHLLNKEIFDVFPAKGILANIVCVDDLVKAILTINSDESLYNKNYHIFDLCTISFEEIINISSRCLGFKKPKLVHPDDFDIRTLSSVQKKLLENTVYAFNPHVVLESCETIRILQKNGFSFHSLDEKLLLKQLEYARKVRFINYDNGKG